MKKVAVWAVVGVLLTGCATQMSSFREADTAWKHKVYVLGKSKIDESMSSTSYQLSTTDPEGSLEQSISQGTSAVGMQSEDSVVAIIEAVGSVVGKEIANALIGALMSPVAGSGDGGGSGDSTTFVEVSPGG